MCFGGSDASGAIAQQEEARRKAITEGAKQINTAFAGFNPEFYGGLQQNYLSSVLPQLGQQFRRTQNQLGTSLANQGLLRSSSARNLGALLQQQMGQNLTQVGNQATQATQDLQRQIQQQKTNLLAQLQASTDPTSTAQQAIGTAAGFASPSIVQPLGDLFQNWSNIYLSRQLGNTYGPNQMYRQGQASPLPVGNYNVGG